jgi:TRAP-type C4-dicarboxylate transport system permease small subunit
MIAMARHNHSGALAGPGQESPGKTGGRGLLDRLMAVEKAIAGIEIWVVIAALAVIILAVLVSVLIRSFALALPDTGEIAIVAMSPLTFVGGALCSHLHLHLSGDLLANLPEGRLKRGLDAVVAFLTGLFGLFFVVLAWDLFAYAFETRETLIDFGTPVALPVGFMLCGAVLIVFHAGLDIWRALAGRKPGGIDPWC